MNKIKNLEIDKAIFEKGFAKDCGPFDCDTSCCRSGVYLDQLDIEKIKPYTEEIKKNMDQTQSKDENLWFDYSKEIDPDFPSGFAYSTNVINNKCAFMMQDGKCSLQVFGDNSGLGRWAIKPYFCIAFPISIENGMLTIDDYRQGETKCCSVIDNRKESIIKSCKDELIFVLGDSGYEELQKLEVDFNQNKF